MLLRDRIVNNHQLDAHVAHALAACSSAVACGLVESSNVASVDATRGSDRGDSNQSYKRSCEVPLKVNMATVGSNLRHCYYWYWACLSHAY